MAATEYDLVIVGGGVGGAALAKVMAENGSHVLLVERETEFKDRVRGEAIVPWGVAEADELGLLPALEAANARQLRWLNQYLGPQQIEHRDLVATTKQKRPIIACYHPAMQQALLGAARQAGAEIKRGLVVTTIVPGELPCVSCQGDSGREFRAKLVIIADGRSSALRKMAGFQVSHDTHTLLLAGVLLEGVPLPDDTAFLCTNIAIGEEVAFFPQGGGRARTYLGYWAESKPRLQGDRDLPRLISDLRWTGELSACVDNAVQAGPLASFETADSWVEHPYRDGIALIGDAAGASDPAWGQGLAVTLRDVRLLRDFLLADSNWRRAADEYAKQRHIQFKRVNTYTRWMREFFLHTDAAAHERRAWALPLIGQDPTRVPDNVFSGPDLPVDAATRARFFGEDLTATATG